MARLRSQSDILKPITSATLSVGETAPTSPQVGQRWFRLSSGITYQYTNDGASNFWLDISSGGIGTSAGRAVDFVGDTDPHLETNGTGLAVGKVYYNKVEQKHFVCTTATTNANVWSGRYNGSGGTETTYKSGSSFYRVHTFLSSGTFYMDSTTSCDILVVAGGGGGGSQRAGGGGAGGFRTQAGLSVTAATYTITVGAGGAAVKWTGDDGFQGNNGGNSSFGSVAALLSTGGGGGGGGQGGGGFNDGADGGSGGGGGANAGDGGAAIVTSPVQGFRGGNMTSSNLGGVGGGGASAQGVDGVNASVGGAGATNAYRTGSNITYAGGGGGGSSNISGAAGGAGGGGNGAGTAGDQGDVGTDGLGGGGGGAGNYGNGGGGGSGIIVVRYLIA